MLKVVRWTLGRIILMLNGLFSPTSPKRSAVEQSAIDESAKELILYQFHACPFCVKVRRELKRLGVTIETRDASRDAQYRRELLEGGGNYKVPCLRIGGSEPTWLYESDAIIRYLRERFALVSNAQPPASTESSLDGMP